MVKVLKKIYKELILIGSICLVSVVLILVFSHKNEDVYAYIYENNGGKSVLVKTIDLSVEDNTREFTVELSGEVVTIEVKHNAIRVVNAPCKHKDCMATGWTSNPNKPIVCLDLGYYIMVKSTSDVDVVA